MSREREEIDVFVRCTLKNGKTYQQGWETPVAFGLALSKGARWMREYLREQRVPGRSRIDSITVTVNRTGDVYKREADE